MAKMTQLNKVCYYEERCLRDSVWTPWEIISIDGHNEYDDKLKWSETTALTIKIYMSTQKYN